MKQLIIILLFAIIPNLVNANENLRPKAYLGEYGIQKQNTIIEYQKYVGNTVKYLPAETELGQLIDKKGFLEIGGNINQEYIITQIYNKKERIIFVLKEKNGKKSIKMVVNNQETPNKIKEDRYCITHEYSIPLLLVDKLNIARKEYIGKSLSIYEITDILPFRSSKEYYKNHYPRIYIQLTNKTNNSVVYYEINELNLLEKGAQFIGKKYSFLNQRIELPGFNNKEKKQDNPWFYEIIDFSIIKKENYYTNKMESHLMFKLQHNVDKSITHSNLSELDIYNDLGRVFANAKFKHFYRVVKILNSKDKIEFVIKNSVNNKEKIVSKDIAHKIAFADDSSGNFNAILSKVEKPANQSIRYGKTITLTDKGVNKYNYIDNVIDITLLTTSKQFVFSIKNLSPNTIRIIWDEAAFIDTDGATSKIIHKGIQFIKREESQPPTSIIKNAKLEDIIIPTNKIYFSNISNEWNNHSLFSNVDKNSNNQTIRLMLPIEIKGVTNEYIFEFSVNYVYDNPELLKI